MENKICAVRTALKNFISLTNFKNYTILIWLYKQFIYTYILYIQHNEINVKFGNEFYYVAQFKIIKIIICILLNKQLSYSGVGKIYQIY